MTSFEQMAGRAKALKTRRRVALAGAHDLHSLEAVLEAREKGIVEPVLVGERAAVEAALASLGRAADGLEIVDSAGENPGAAAARCVRDNRADFLMKGGIDTRDILKPVLDKSNGLATGRTMCGFAIAQLPSYHKLIANADGAMLIQPTLEEKRDTIISSVAVLRSLGIAQPKVAVLCAAEKVSEKMPDTVDAAKLAELNRSGVIADCTVTGPISYDLIMSRESAAIKGFDCPHCGDFDLILSPNIATGNTLTKCWAYSAGAVWAGMVLGARVPIVLVSRGSSAEEKYYSLVLAALTSGGDL